MTQSQQLTRPVWAPAGRKGTALPELVDPRLADVELLARWFDYAYELPGGFRFGWAGVIGLIPGIGDILDALISLYIVTRAVQIGIPRVALMRMLLNICIEGLAGSVPFLGDLFDVAFKANRRNYLILNNHVTDSRQQSQRDWAFVAGAGLLAVATVVIPALLLAELVKHL